MVNKKTDTLKKNICERHKLLTTNPFHEINLFIVFQIIQESLVSICAIEENNSVSNMSRIVTKQVKWHVRPVKTQIGLGIRQVWSESSLCAQWVAKDPSFLQADSEDTDQTGRMPRLIWVFAGRTCHFVGCVTMRIIYCSEHIYYTFGNFILFHSCKILFKVFYMWGLCNTVSWLIIRMRHSFYDVTVVYVRLSFYFTE